jgi:hypothetical protein
VLLRCAFRSIRRLLCSIKGELRFVGLSGPSEKIERELDDRLIPINGLIALLRGEAGWPGLLRDQGFERHQFEVPVSTPLGDIRVDALVYRCEPDLVLLSECKSGRNIEEGQARKYVAVDELWLRRSGAVPPRVRLSSSFAVHTMFVGREEHRASLEASLRHLDIAAPLLTVGSNRVRLSDASATRGLDDFDEAHEGGLPPGRFAVDHQSADKHLLDVLIPQVIAAQALQEDIVLVESICERILPEWQVLSHSGRSSFVSRVGNLLKGLATGEMRGQFRYEGLKQPHTRGRVVIDVSPAKRDPRGRTQAWQAQQKRAAAALRRRAARERAGQLSLDQLADEGGLADE